MKYKVIINGNFKTLNTYINKDRRSKFQSNEMKKKDQHKISYHLKKQLKKAKIKPPVFLKYSYHEKNRRRDHDNVSGYFHKVFQDALQESGYLKDDGWDYVVGFSDSFHLDRNNPRIEIEIIESVDA